MQSHHGLPPVLVGLRFACPTLPSRPNGPESGPRPKKRQSPRSTLPIIPTALFGRILRMDCAEHEKSPV